jgi:hypothetical protein
VYYKCVKFHKYPIGCLGGGVALTRHKKEGGMYLVSATPTKRLIEFL